MRLEQSTEGCFNVKQLTMSDCDSEWQLGATDVLQLSLLRREK